MTANLSLLEGLGRVMDGIIGITVLRILQRQVILIFDLIMTSCVSNHASI